jgi:uncharacterized protein (UPF0276 family)
MLRPREIGIGLVCLPGLEPAVVEGRDRLDWVEIEPQVSWLPECGVESVLQSGPARVARNSGLPILLHSVGAPVGGSIPPPQDQVDLLASLVEEFGCPWISEHLSILRIPSRGSPVSTGALLAPPQTEAAVDIAATNINGLSEGVGVPVAFETGVNYLRPRGGEIPDGLFFRAVAEAADCGILLDLHNLWCNEQNGRQPVQEVLATLPLERVWEIHVAGGYWQDGYYLDAHSGLAADPVLNLLAEVITKTPQARAVVFEVSPDRIGRDSLTVERIVEHLSTLADVIAEAPESADERPVHVIKTMPPVTVVTARPAAPPPPLAFGEFQRWEQVLGGLVLGQDVRGALVEDLRADTGHQVWRTMATASRRGQLAGALPFTVRLLVLTLGEAELLRVLGDLWQRMPPAPTSWQEIQQLVPHLRLHWGDVPCFAEVLDYELALHRCALRRDLEQAIEFPYDPAEIFGAVAAGRLPVNPKPNPHVIVIPPRDAP